MAWIQTANCPTCGQWVRGDSRRCAQCETVLVPPPPVVGTETWSWRPPSSDGKPVRIRSSEYALIFGVAGFLASLVVVGVPLAIAALALGISARRRIQDSAGELTGNGLAMSGIVLGVLGISIALAMVIGLLLTGPGP
jgi:hypothetical protein